MPTPTGLIVPNAGMPSYVWGSSQVQQQKDLYGEVVGGGAQQMEYQYLRVVEDESRDSAAGSALYSAGAADALEAPDQMNDDELVIPAASSSSTSAMPPPRIVKGKGKGKATKSKTQEVRGSGNGVVFRPSSTTSSVVQPAKNEEEISPVSVVGISPIPSSACAAPAAESMSTPASNAEMTAQFQQQRAPSAEDFSTPKDDQHELSADKLTPSRTSIGTTAPRTLFGTTSLFANSTPAVTATTPAGSIFGPPAGAGGAPAVASTTPSPPKPATQQPQDAETTSLVSGFQSLFSPSRTSVTSLGGLANIDISPTASGGAGAGLFGGGGAATSTQSQPVPVAIPVGEAAQPGQGQGGVGFGASSPSPAASPTRLFLSFASVASGMSIGPGGPADQIPLAGDAVSDTPRPDVNMDFGEVPPDIDMEEADHDML